MAMTKRAAKRPRPPRGRSKRISRGGNITARDEGGEEYTQEFSGNDRMVSVPDLTTVETWTFGYDGEGSRIIQTIPDGTAYSDLLGMKLRIATI
jgi:hypothetical protein